MASNAPDDWICPRTLGELFPLHSVAEEWRCQTTDIDVFLLTSVTSTSENVKGLLILILLPSCVEGLLRMGFLCTRVIPIIESVQGLLMMGFLFPQLLLTIESVEGLLKVLFLCPQSPRRLNLLKDCWYCLHCPQVPMMFEGVEELLMIFFPLLSVPSASEVIEVFPLPSGCPEDWRWRSTVDDVYSLAVDAPDDWFCPRTLDELFSPSSGPADGWSCWRIVDGVLPLPSVTSMSELLNDY